MKLMVPVERESLDTPVCPSFGRTPFFAIYDTENDTYAFIGNEGEESQGGAGIKAAQILVDHGIAAVITYRLGENAAEVLHAAGIKIYRAEDGSIKKNIEDYKAGQLAILSATHPGFHNHGGK